ncbi:ATP-binding protein [Terracidiphilus gabretensis]|uniref:ATP-binding protein n=1 Tax=Terracidiphilus gabretensis TaxID=1577687 RepID=UPI00071B7C4F|nr:ATP-binding protein [Terracidiphilus gabretensis]
MRLKTKLVLAITALVMCIAGTLSLVYVSQILHTSIEQSHENNRMVAEQVRFSLQNALESGLRDRTLDPAHPEQLHDLALEAVRNNQPLQAVIDSVNRYSFTVYDINIGDYTGQILLSTNPLNLDKPLPARPNYDQLLNAGPVQLAQVVFGAPQIYDVVVPLERNNRPFVSVHVGVSTTFLRAVYKPWLKESSHLMGFVLGAALVVALLLGNFALRPIEEISMQLDYWVTPSDGEDQAQVVTPVDPAIRVSHQIERIGQRMRDVQEVFSNLKGNLDQLLGNLQDGLLLFTADNRVVLISDAARRFLHVDPDLIHGLHASEIFDRSTVLGKTLRDAFDSRTALIQEEIFTETGGRIQASVHFIHDDETSQGLGSLVTLRDLESVEAIESGIELSSRMSAIGRLTSGVAHEVKNPINAIVVHLELLKNKLGDTSPPAMRHLDIIESEIHRLDRVVQSLIDFSRPVELHLQENDLRVVVAQVGALAFDELSTRGVHLLNHLPPKSVVVNSDPDLLKQALLNVILNGAQAMPEGGRLDVVVESDRKTALIRVQDEGVGIPDDIREKIFDLYFTTKSGGSGIGLAMTYRILQLHHGSVEVQSREVRGTEFCLCIPLAYPERTGRYRLQTAGVEPHKGTE